MCTMISQQVGIDGSGKGTGGWFAVRRRTCPTTTPSTCRWNTP